ncbi:MAG: polysaccharide deacetylase family protein [Coxiellaceae bacterium]|jgi:peptidoglycan/xylan/chitin deacetylase (PgdA/CDA1 family)|nr:polysaccharide deacetylase family protein [Coxiellaceae bacterium]
MRACLGIKSARTTKKVVALTFDDGPSQYTKEILKVLEANNTKATFFVIGKNVIKYPQTVKEIHIKGNIVGNHTYSHPYLPNLSGDDIETELTKNSSLIFRIIGFTPRLFRPPYGSCSVKSRIVAKNLGLIPIFWSSITDDYRYQLTTSTKITLEIINLVRPGAIICLHDGGGNRKKTVEALKIIIFILKNEGYEFLTIPELLGIPAYES